MKNSRAILPAGIAFCAAYLLLSAVSTWPVLRHPDQVFAFNDGPIERGLSPTTKKPAAFLQLWDNQAFLGIPAGQSIINTASTVESILGPYGYRRIGVLLSIWFTGFAGYWALRQFRRSPWASGLGGLLLMLCGWNLTFPMNGLSVRAYCLAWTALSLGMMESARENKSWLRYAIAGGFLGLGISDTADVGAFFALAAGGYFVLTHFFTRSAWRPRGFLHNSAKLVIYIACSVLLASQTIATMLKTQVGASAQLLQDTPEERYHWATQWSVPKIETWSLLAPNFHGVTSRNAERPYWGRIGRSEGWELSRQGFRNFSLAGYYISVVPTVFMAILLATLLGSRDQDLLSKPDRRRIWACFALAAISLALAWGKHFPLYRLLYALPHLSSIRNPDKWLGPFSLFVAILTGVGFDLLFTLRDYPDPAKGRLLKKGWALFAAVPGIGFVTTFVLSARRSDIIQGLSQDGFADKALLSWQNAFTANIELVVVSLILAGILVAVLYFRRNTKVDDMRRLASIGTCFLLALILLKAGRPYAMGLPTRHLQQPNVLTDYLEKVRGRGRIKLMPPQHGLINHWRMSFLLAGGYDLFDPVSIRTIPSAYKRFFEALQTRPDRLWQMGSIRFFLCAPDAATQLANWGAPNRVFEPRMGLTATASGGAYIPAAASKPEQAALWLMEYTPALPMIRSVDSVEWFPDTPEGDARVLERLAGESFRPETMATIQSPAKPEGLSLPSGGIQRQRIEITRRDPATVEMKTSGPLPGLLIRAVKHDPDWKVRVDGREQPLLRTDFLLQGVMVPPGQHEVVFEYRPPRGFLFLSLAGRIALGLTLGLWIVRGRFPARS